MIEIIVPGWRHLQLSTLVLDLNGTLAVDGRLLPVHASVAELVQRLDVCLLSADTHGTLEEVAAELRVRAVRLRPGGGESQQKAEFVQQLGADSVVAVGNGANDVGMLEIAALSLTVLGDEGCAVRAIQASELLVGSADEALDLLLHPLRLVATLRR
ncbi:MAG: ATPase P [Candidatus Dormiibacterota bacterium]